MEEITTSDKVVEAATIHAAAIEEARQTQVEQAIHLGREETKNIFAQAMREVLTTGDEGTKALLIQKIPLLCTDIIVMKSDIKTIKSVGMYILLGIGALFLTLVGSLLLSHVGIVAK